MDDTCQKTTNTNAREQPDACNVANPWLWMATRHEAPTRNPFVLQTAPKGEGGAHGQAWLQGARAP